MFYAIANFLLRVLLRVLTSAQVNGLENFPHQGPAIVLANHVHFLDPPVLGALLPRKIRFMAKIELFRAPLLGWVVKGYDAFPVRRGERDRQALEQALGVLAEGGVLGMFPEGTRSRTGRLQRAHPGAALAALRSGAPVVPVGVVGTDRALRWPNILLRPSIVLNVGPSFVLSAERTNRTSLAQAADDMMRRLASLLPPDQRGFYADAVVPERV